MDEGAIGRGGEWIRGSIFSSFLGLAQKRERETEGPARQRAGGGRAFRRRGRGIGGRDGATIFFLRDSEVGGGTIVSLHEVSPNF